MMLMWRYVEISLTLVWKRQEFAQRHQQKMLLTSDSVVPETRF